MTTADQPHEARKAPMLIAEWRKSRKSASDLAAAHAAKLSPLKRLACWITARVGTMGFFLIILGWTVIWLGWNLLAPKSMRFDPPMGFVFYLFISNVIQILLMPLIMVGQNVQGEAADRRSQYDLDVNVKAEQEIEVILEHLEYQNDMLIALTRGLDVKLDATVEALPQEIKAKVTRIRKAAPRPEKS